MKPLAWFETILDSHCMNFRYSYTSSGVTRTSFWNRRHRYDVVVQGRVMDWRHGLGANPCLRRGRDPLALATLKLHEHLTNKTSSISGSCPARHRETEPSALALCGPLRLIGRLS